MTNNFELVVFAPDREEYSALRSLLAGSDQVVAFQGNGAVATAEYELDALFVTGMAITYLGLPPFLRNHAEVAVSPEEMTARGLPRLFVAGWLLPDDHPESYGVRYAELLLRAIEEYNAVHPESCIERVGSLPDPLGLKGEHASRSARELKALMARRVPSGRNIESHARVA